MTEDFAEVLTICIDDPRLQQTVYTMFDSRDSIEEVTEIPSGMLPGRFGAEIIEVVREEFDPDRRKRANIAQNLHYWFEFEVALAEGQTVMEHVFLERTARFRMCIRQLDMEDPVAR